MLAGAALMPASAYAYGSDRTSNSIGEVHCEGSNPRTYYGSSVQDVMNIIDDMTSSTNNPWQVSEFTVTLLKDWDSGSYGVIKIEDDLKATINLNGHMINRNKTTADTKFSGSGNGEVLRICSGATCTINGGDTTTAHYGTFITDSLNGKFWKYNGTGSENISGGLITGGACDDEYRAGGISVETGARLELNYVTVAGNVSDTYLSYNGCGGGICTRGSLVLKHSKVLYNHAEASGGGIYAANPSAESPTQILIDQESEVSYNTALKNAGGIDANIASGCTIKAGKLWVIEVSNGSKVSHNIAKEDGGGFYGVNNGSGGAGLKLSSNSQVSDNKTYANGGGVCFKAASLSKGLEMDSNCSISNNRADGNGGGIWSGQEFYLGDQGSTGTWRVYGSINDNSAGGSGGGVCFGSKGVSSLKQKIEFHCVQMSGNSCNGNGGAIAILGARGMTTLCLGRYSSFNGNAAGGNGGAIYVDAEVDLEGEGGLTFDGNVAGANGGAIFSEKNSCHINLFNTGYETIFTNNKARYNGGAIAINHSSSYTMHVLNAKFTGNAAGTTSDSGAGCGGAIWFNNELYLEDVTVQGNTATCDGGGVYCNNSSYSAFEVAHKIVISGNKIVKRSDSGTQLSELRADNLSLKGKQDVCGASGDRALNADSRIGFTVRDYDKSDRRLSGNQGFLTEGLGDSWSSYIFSDNESYSIVRNGNYLYLHNGAPKYTLSVYSTSATPVTSEHTAGETVSLKGSDYTWTVTDGGVQKTVQPDYWSIAFADGTVQTVTPVDGVATFTMGKGVVTARARYIEPLASVFAGISDFASWDNLKTGAVGSEGSSGYAYIHYIAFTGEWGGSSSRGESASKDSAKVVRRDVKDIKVDSGNYVSAKEVTYTLAINVPDAASEAIYIKDGAAVGSDFENVLKSFNGEPKTSVKGECAGVEDGVMTLTYTVTVENPDKRTCKVTFNAGEGASLPSGVEATRTVAYNSQLGDLPVPTYEDHVFDGWYAGDTRVSSTTAIKADTELTAHWTKAQTYREVRYIDSDGSIIDTDTVEVGEKVTKPSSEPIKAGHSFAGWYADKDCATKFDFGAAVASGSDPICIYAKWTKKSYKVSFDLAGGSDSDAAGQEVDYGDKVAKPKQDPVRQGYTFLGWYAGSSLYNFDTAVTGNITIRAAWEINTYSIIFEANNGEKVTEQVVEYGGFVEKPADPSYAGHAFKGWYTDKACTVAYNFSSFVIAPVHLYAKWGESATVTLDPDNGTDPEVRTYDVNAKLGDLPHPLRKDYVFDGWYSGDIKVSEETMVTGDMTLVAKWQPKTYTVRFETSGGSAVDEQYVPFNGKAQRPADDPTRSGYTFGGWYADDTCTVRFDFDAVVTGDTTVYAKWASNDEGYVSYTVKFDSAGGSAVDDQHIESGDKAKKPADPVREGYTFVGWQLDGEDYDFSKPVTKAITLTAVWVKDTASIEGAQVALERVKLAYSGRVQVAKVASVMLGGVLLEEGRDYQVSVAGGKLVGAYQVTVTGVGDYSGQVTTGFKIVPAKVTGLKAKATSGLKAVKLTWASHKTQTTGFRVYWAASKARLAKGKFAGKATVKKARAKAATVTGLKSGKRYYFKVRAYKVVDGKRYWSAWSKVRSAKAK